MANRRLITISHVPDINLDDMQFLNPPKYAFLECTKNNNTKGHNDQTDILKSHLWLINTSI